MSTAKRILDLFRTSIVDIINHFTEDEVIKGLKLNWCNLSPYDTQEGGTVTFLKAALEDHLIPLETVLKVVAARLKINSTAEWTYLMEHWHLNREKMLESFGETEVGYFEMLNKIKFA